MAVMHRAKTIIKLLTRYILDSRELKFAIDPQIKGVYYGKVLDHVSIEFVLLYKGQARECRIELHGKYYGYLKVSGKSFFKHIRISSYKKNQEIINEFAFWFYFSFCENAIINKWWQLVLDEKAVGVRVLFANSLYDILCEDAVKCKVPFDALKSRYFQGSPMFLKAYKKDGEYVTLDQLEGSVKVKRFEDLDVLKSVLKTLLELIGYERERFED